MRNELPIMLMLVIASALQLFTDGVIAAVITAVTLVFALYLTYQEYRSREKAEAEYQFALLAGICIAASFFLDSLFTRVLRVFFVYFLVRFAFSVVYSDNRKIAELDADNRMKDDSIKDLDRKFESLGKEITDIKAANAAFENDRYAINGLMAKVDSLYAKVSAISSSEYERKKFDERLFALSSKVAELKENSVSPDRLATVVGSLDKEIEKLNSRIDMVAATSPTYEELEKQISEAISASEAVSSERHKALCEEINRKIVFSYEKVLDNIYQEMPSILQEKFRQDMDEMRKSIKSDIDAVMTSIPQNNTEDLKEEILAAQSQLYTDLNTRINELVEKVNSTAAGNGLKPVEKVPGPNEVVENSQIRSYFEAALKGASKEIDVICPWISPKVVDSLMIDKFERLLNKNVTIKILYGIGNIASQPGQRTDKRNEQTEAIAKNLQKKLKKYPNFKMKKGNTHQKLFICDDKFYINSSFNILSFKGSYDGTDKDVRTESGEYSTDIRMIKTYREKYFSF